jgi:23S rRNA (cytidine1920-2'-O)/16S rRNA (cytidine1409-2'-O)-methyltransferase
MKKRLDLLVLEQFPHYSRQQIQGWIMRGLVLVNGVPQTKPGSLVSDDVALTLNVASERFVGRAGYKLEKALDHFGISVQDLVAMDAGISTGGFTDCLLQRGIRRVFGVDVGYGQVHEKIRTNERLTLMERTNLRHLTSLEEPVDIVTLDLSFISVLKVMGAVTSLLKPGGILIVLIKPQFEAERREIGKGGIIKDDAVHQRVIQKVTAGVQQHGFTFHGIVESPILGGSGNKEFLAYFVLSKKEGA